MRSSDHPFHEEDRTVNGFAIDVRGTRPQPSVTENQNARQSPS
ncbi:hypothetical protein HMPREF9621_01271 [Cutibacterium modestum HL037PA2]|nr:hypothetical protein HMPREF9621_01271 [Cutibacterium modestum HL037PA2]